jgi:integrase/recombinase XerC
VPPTTRRPVVCSTCRTPLSKGACPNHGPRNKDGSSPDKQAAARANKGVRFPPKPLEAIEVKQLLGACTDSATGRRNAALIAVLYGSGIRIAEALALHPGDISFKDGTLWIGHGKGDRQRTVAIDAEALTRIKVWLDVRPKLGLTRHRPLFCTLKGARKGAPLDSRYVRHLLPRLARRAGLNPKRRVHAHALRHTHAKELALEGKPTLLISKQLGHANISTTSGYLDHIAPAELVAALRDRPPWDTRAG